MSSVLPGAEPFDHAGGPVGVLLCHGFTGSPQTLRGWAEYLAAQGLTVSLPRLPGHGRQKKGGGGAGGGAGGGGGGGPGPAGGGGGGGVGPPGWAPPRVPSSGQ